MNIKGVLFRKIQQKRLPGKHNYQFDLSPEDQKKLIPEATRKTLIEMQATVDRISDKNVELTDDIKKMKAHAEQETMQQAFEQEQILEKQKRENVYPLFFSGKKKPFLMAALSNNQYFRDDYGKPWKQWAGLLCEITRSGAGFRFLLSNPDEKGFVALPKGPIPLAMFPYMFNDGTLIGDLRAGRVGVNMTVEGDYTQPYLTTTKEELSEATDNIKSSKDIQSMIKIDLTSVLKNADDDTRASFFLIYNELYKYMGRCNMLETRNKKLLLAKKEAEMLAESTSESYGEAMATINSMLDKHQQIASSMTSLKSSEIEARMSASVMESMYDGVLSKVEGLQDRLKAGEKGPEVMKEIQDWLIQFSKMFAVGVQAKKPKDEGEDIVHA